MRTFEEAMSDARDRPAFSNGTEGYGWMDANCDRCIHDKPSRQGRAEDGCPLILVTLLDKTPIEFLDGPRNEQGLYGIADQYHCIEFRDEDEGPSPEPTPIPDPPGQGLLLPREDYEAPLMFTANTLKAVSVE